MKPTILSCLLVLTLGAMVFGCRATKLASGDENFQEIYLGYRELVLKAIAAGKEARLPQMTTDYFNESGKHALLVTVSQRDPHGKWQVLLDQSDPAWNAMLPAIHYREPEDVHIYKADNYVLLETGKSQQGDYPGGLHIRMAIRR